jgi:hypothetical protein
MEINIENYLSDSEIKEIVVDELRNQIRQHFRDESNANRLLSNLAHSIVQDEVEKIVPNHHETLVKKVASLIQGKDLSYYVFNHRYSDGKPESYGAKLIEQTVIENKEVIKQKVVDAIQNKDYSDEALIKLENLSESFASNIYSFVELIRSKNNV